MLAKKGGATICLSVVLLVGLISPHLIWTGRTESVKTADPSVPIEMPEIGETLEDLIEFIQGIIDKIEKGIIDKIGIVSLVASIIDSTDALTDVISDIGGIAGNAFLAITTPSWLVEILDILVASIIDSTDALTDVISDIGGIAGDAFLAITTPSWLVQIIDTTVDGISNIIGLSIDSIDVITDVISDIGGIAGDAFLAITTPSWLHAILETIAGAGLGAIGFGVIGLILTVIGIKLIDPIALIEGPLSLIDPFVMIPAVLVGIIFAVAGAIINAP